MSAGIYQILNLNNGMRYIGSSIRITTRKNEHYSSLRNGIHYNTALQDDYVIHRESSFEFKILETTTDTSGLLVLEYQHIIRFDFDTLYNRIRDVHLFARGTHPNNKEIAQIEPNTSEVIRIYPSAAVAAREIKRHKVRIYQTVNQRIDNRGRPVLTCGGSHWVYTKYLLDCSNCRWPKPKNPEIGERYFCCPECGLTIRHFENGSNNMKNS